MKTFEKCESQVRSYSRSFPTVFEYAKGSYIQDESGNRYIDLFAGAGALNFGHNNSYVNACLVKHIKNNGIIHSLDLATSKKEKFIKTFNKYILKPRGLKYKIQFCSPSGANSVESAIKLARKVKGRRNVISFTNAYHGVTQGALSVTGNECYRNENYRSSSDVTFLPYCGYANDTDEIWLIDKMISDKSSGIDKPSAIILETVQGEGGINVASREWLKGISKICKKNDILLIVDDIQAGVGRTGHFFSFEFADIKPDIVCLSKSIGGGLPMAINLIKPKYDKWEAGEHSGTFRGNNLAFVSSRAIIEQYFNDNKVYEMVDQKSRLIRSIMSPHVKKITGRGLMLGLHFKNQKTAKEVSKLAFKNKVIIETCGSDNHVLKILPPLNIGLELLEKAVKILISCIKQIEERHDDS